MKTTMFKLVAGDGGVIRTACFGEFDDDPEKGRALAEAYIRQQRDRWSAQEVLHGESLRIVEE